MEPFHLRRSPLQPLSAGFTPLEARLKKAADTKRVLLLMGFTLVEMVVVLGIIAAVTGIALTSQNSFNKTLILANTAYDIALTFRSAESFGLSSRALGSTANAGYGLHFQRGASESFILFADIWPPTDLSCTRPDCKPGDHIYSTEDKLVQTYVLGNGITIADFCALPDQQQWQCLSTGDLNALDVSFSRPNPDAFITANSSTFVTSYTKACLVIMAGNGASRFVSVAASGEIIAEAPGCPTS